MTVLSGRPDIQFKVDFVRACVWKNVCLLANGKMLNRHKIVVERTSRDRRGNLTTCCALEIEDLPKAILALKKAYDYLTTKEQRAGDLENVSVRDSKSPTRIP